MENFAESASAPSVLRTLNRAITEAFEEVSAGFASASQHPELASSIVNNGRFMPALSRLLELGGWVKPRIRRPKLSKEQTASFAAFMVENGVKPELAVRLATIRRRGAPVKKRRAAVLAWEIKLAHPDETWNALARRFCDCGNARHDFYCQDRLRREVGHLKKVLKKHHITLS
jgi:hypothetical protein